MKKIPQRQCVGCRVMMPKKDLARVVRSPDGVVTLDRTGKSPGRGAYLCHQSACLAKARKSRAIDRAFGVPLPEDVWTALAAQLEKEDG